jgi:hypothetical protein
MWDMIPPKKAVEPSREERKYVLGIDELLMKV